MKFPLRVALCALLLLAPAAPVLVGQDEPPDYKSNLPADDPAIRYPRSPADDAAQRLADQLAHGAALDARSGPLGFLPALLDRLHVGTDSQMLVFSKTSFQAARISPGHPRAIYFNDDVAVAYVPGAPTLEIAAVDPTQGPVFYTMTVAGDRPSIARGATCLRCHQGPNTAGVPGVYVGSVIPGPNGAPLRDESAIVTDHRSPFAERWGGWYVTAARGEQPDRANAVASNPADPGTLVRDARQNLTTLAGLFDPAGYLAATSDIVALMVFEHQTQMTNLMTRVAWDARLARLKPRATDFDGDVEDLVEYMLFAGEAPLTVPIEGVSTFAKSFPARGPRDRRGRSLRDFDLKTRLFRYPLSYMIYSAQFDALPGVARDRIYRRLYDVLTGAPGADPFAHLSAADRAAILAILRDTKTNLPGYWRHAVRGGHAGPPLHGAGRTHRSAPTGSRY